MSVKHFLTAVTLSIFLVACGGTSDDSNQAQLSDNELPTGIEQTEESGDPELVVQPTANEATGFDDQLLAYQDSFLRFNYPTDWRLETNNPDLSAQIFAPESSSAGGNPNCTIASTFDSSTSLVAVTEEVAELLFVSSAEVEYFTLNGTSVSRTAGNVSIFSFIIPVVQQFAFKDGYGHFIQCFDVAQEDQDLILNSMEIL